MKFKVGDQVEYIGHDHDYNHHCYPLPHTVGTVVAVYDGGVSVQWPHGSTSIDDLWGVRLTDIKKVERRADMTKADLKPGMVVKLRNGELGAVNTNGRLVGLCIDYFTDDLIRKDDARQYDIVEIYAASIPIWTRKDTKKMTMREVCAMAGCNVEIIKE